VVDVPAKLSARARLFDTGHNRKTDAPRPEARTHDRQWARSRRPRAAAARAVRTRRGPGRPAPGPRARR
jgi:hypothetical protein